MLEKHFETVIDVDIPQEDLWSFFSDIQNLVKWNPNFKRYACNCSNDSHHQQLFTHYDLDRNEIGIMLIEEVDRDENLRIRFSVERILYKKRNHNHFEITLNDNTITFTRYLDLSVFDTSKVSYWVKHYKEHHESIVDSLKTLHILDGNIVSEKIKD